MPFVNVIKSAAAPPAAPKSWSYRTNAVDMSALTTYTFNTQDIGTAAADRKVIVGVCGGNSNRTVSSVTVGGVGLVLVGRRTASTSAELWIGTVPTGTTATVVVTWSSGQANFCGIAIWAAYAVLSDTPIDTEDWFPSGPTAVNIPLTTVVDGFIISINASFGAGTPSNEWTVITERFDCAASPGISGADGGTSGTSTTPTNACNNFGNGNAAGIAASF